MTKKVKNYNKEEYQRRLLLDINLFEIRIDIIKKLAQLTKTFRRPEYIRAITRMADFKETVAANMDSDWREDTLSPHTFLPKLQSPHHEEAPKRPELTYTGHFKTLQEVIKNPHLVNEPERHPTERKTPTTRRGSFTIEPSETQIRARSMSLGSLENPPPPKPRRMSLVPTEEIEQKEIQEVPPPPIPKPKELESKDTTLPPPKPKRSSLQMQEQTPPPKPRRMSLLPTEGDTQREIQKTQEVSPPIPKPQELRRDNEHSFSPITKND
ncbi:hypothetical protein EIN_273700 [Entamoeba invadens IP1]|uniref:Uncharacterized protein n=1 Tax=Entamoeba invadens IP1 TaxID=370355 RepID=A0A0A1U4M5_ENTIV|nr:hypothetical protein EIN_273700 [Entamoeba invadens IP1]ELP87833.1 hypothetical protein EIN_273700 [Entamoeba invadens IP1]|eukprot:XP_004254604.1 hypothetical protein EIN_273700 [Entamoeba invadens IP1]